MHRHCRETGDGLKIAAEPASFYSSLLERLESENGIEDTFAAVVDRERMFADEVQLFAVSVGPGFLVGKCSKLIVPIRHTVAVVMNFTPEFSSDFTSLGIISIKWEETWS